MMGQFRAKSRVTSDNLFSVTTAAQETSIFGEQPDPCIMMTLQTDRKV